jgi:hypothetical protein
MENPAFLINWIRSFFLPMKSTSVFVLTTLSLTSFRYETPFNRFDRCFDPTLDRIMTATPLSDSTSRAANQTRHLLLARAIYTYVACTTHAQPVQLLIVNCRRWVRIAMFPLQLPFIPPKTARCQTNRIPPCQSKHGPGSYSAA